MPIIPKTNGNKKHITFPAERHSHRSPATKKSVTIRDSPYEKPPVTSRDALSGQLTGHP